MILAELAFLAKKMEQLAWILWVVLGVGLIIAEIFTLGFVLFWFGIGAFVAALVGFLGFGFGWQFLAFALVSVVLTAMSRTMTCDPSMVRATTLSSSASVDPETCSGVTRSISCTFVASIHPAVNGYANIAVSMRFSSTIVPVASATPVLILSLSSLVVSASVAESSVLSLSETIATGCWFE